VGPALQAVFRPIAGQIDHSGLALYDQSLHHIMFQSSVCCFVPSSEWDGRAQVCSHAPFHMDDPISPHRLIATPSQLKGPP
jgi:hypothetical protein